MSGDNAGCQNSAGGPRGVGVRDVVLENPIRSIRGSAKRAANEIVHVLLLCNAVAGCRVQDSAPG